MGRKVNKKGRNPDEHFASSNMLRAGDDDLVERYTRARAIQADRMAEEIGEFGYDAAGNPKIKLADKRAALVDLGRHFALFSERGEVSRRSRSAVRALRLFQQAHHLRVVDLLDRGLILEIVDLVSCRVTAKPSRSSEAAASRNQPLAILAVRAAKEKFRSARSPGEVASITGLPSPGTI